MRALRGTTWTPGRGVTVSPSEETNDRSQNTNGAGRGRSRCHAGLSGRVWRRAHGHDYSRHMLGRRLMCFACRLLRAAGGTAGGGRAEDVRKRREDQRGERIQSGERRGDQSRAARIQSDSAGGQTPRWPIVGGRSAQFRSAPRRSGGAPGSLI